MPRYIIERSFAEQLELTKHGVENVKRINEEEGVAWIFSFLSADKKKTYCLYEAPNPEAILRGGPPKQHSSRRHHRDWGGNRPQYVRIGIGGSLAAPPLPHHRAYGSVHGGSADYAVWAWAREARRRVLRKSSLGSAMASAGLLLIRQGPWALPAVCAARSRPTPLRRNSA